MDFNRIVRNTPWCLLGIWLKIKFSTSKWLNYSLTLSRRINRLMWVSQNSVSQLITQSCPTLSTPRTAAHQASLSITNSRRLLKLKSIRLVMPSNRLILCRPLLLLPSIFPSIRVFSNESVLHIRWPKYWSFIFSISPSNEYSGLISFRIYSFDLLAELGKLNCLLPRWPSGKQSACQWRLKRCWFSPWVRKIPWRRA